MVEMVLPGRRLTGWGSLLSYRAAKRRGLRIMRLGVEDEPVQSLAPTDNRAISRGGGWVSQTTCNHACLTGSMSE